MSPRGRCRDRSGPRRATAAPPRERLNEHLLHGGSETLPLELLGRRRNVANHRNPIAVLHDGFSLSARKEREPRADRGVARVRRLTSHPEGGWPRLHMRKACAFVSRDFAPERAGASLSMAGDGRLEAGEETGEAGDLDLPVGVPESDRLPIGRESERAELAARRADLSPGPRVEDVELPAVRRDGSHEIAAVARELDPE